MFKFIAAVILFCLASLLIPQSAFALGKFGGVMSCTPNFSGGKIAIERLLYDTASPVRIPLSENTLQFGGLNFYRPGYSATQVLSEDVVKGEVVAKDVQWKGLTLIGYMGQFGRNGQPNDKRSLTEIVPLDEKRHRGPGSVVTMNIEKNTISCEFTTADDIYTAISVSFRFKYQTTDIPDICASGNGEDISSYQVKWFTGKDEAPVKTEDVLISCGLTKGSGPRYDVSTVRISTVGRVEVDFERTKILNRVDSALYPRTPEKAPEAETP